MINLNVATQGKKIFTDYQDKDTTLQEVALMVYELERIKKELLEKEFPDDLKIEKKEGET